MQEREREMERRRSLILRFVKRMQRRKIAIGWTCWWCHVQNERERERKTKRALARWLKSTMTKCLHQWCEKVREILRHRQLLLRATKKILHARLASSLLQWEEVTDERRELRRRVTLMVVRWIQRQLFLGFRRWSTVTSALMRESSLSAEEVSIRLKRTILSRAMKRMLQRSLAVGFQTWSHECLIIGRERMRIKEQAARLLLHRHLRASWSSWCDFMSELQRRRSMLLRTTQRMRARAQVLTFGRWRDSVEERQWLRHLILRACEHGKYLNVQKSW